MTEAQTPQLAFENVSFGFDETPVFCAMSRSNSTVVRR